MHTAVENNLYNIRTCYPDGVEEMGGVIAVYQECIRQGKTWEELLGYDPPNEDVEI